MTYIDIYIYNKLGDFKMKSNETILKMKIYIKNKNYYLINF